MKVKNTLQVVEVRTASSTQLNNIGIGCEVSSCSVADFKTRSVEALGVPRFRGMFSNCANPFTFDVCIVCRNADIDAWVRRWMLL